jgi:aryl-alcohol dehydrogenase-like predicted oxidoreductase
VPFDESALTGKFTPQTKFASDDFRSNYFAGDRVERAVKRVERIRGDLGPEGPGLAEVALKFCLKHDAVSTVIPGMRNVQQAEANLGVGDRPPMSDELERKLRAHRWNRAFWYGGKRRSSVFDAVFPFSFFVFP